jgi:hypothetical protein
MLACSTYERRRSWRQNITSPDGDKPGQHLGLSFLSAAQQQYKCSSCHDTPCECCCFKSTTHRLQMLNCSAGTRPFVSNLSTPPKYDILPQKAVNFMKTCHNIHRQQLQPSSVLLTYCLRLTLLSTCAQSSGSTTSYGSSHQAVAAVQTVNIARSQHCV